MEKRTSHPNYGTYLLQQLKQQYDEDALCDLNLLVEDQTFKMHKCVLAANSAMLSSILANLPYGSSRLVLSSVTVEGFKPLLSYMYTGELDFSCVSPEVVMSAAQKLQLSEAQTICYLYMEKIAGVESEKPEEQAENSSSEQHVYPGGNMLSVESIESQSSSEKVDAVSEDVSCETNLCSEKRDTASSVTNTDSMVTNKKPKRQSLRKRGQFHAEAANSETKERVGKGESSETVQPVVSRGRMVTRGVKLKYPWSSQSQQYSGNAKCGTKQSDLKGEITRSVQPVSRRGRKVTKGTTDEQLLSDEMHIDSATEKNDSKLHTEKNGTIGRGEQLQESSGMVTRRNRQKQISSTESHTDQNTVMSSNSNKRKRSFKDDFVYEFPAKRTRHHASKEVTKTDAVKEVRGQRESTKEDLPTPVSKPVTVTAGKDVDKEGKYKILKSVLHSPESAESGMDSRHAGAHRKDHDYIHTAEPFPSEYHCINNEVSSVPNNKKNGRRSGQINKKENKKLSAEKIRQSSRKKDLGSAYCKFNRKSTDEFSKQVQNFHLSGRFSMAVKCRYCPRKFIHKRILCSHLQTVHPGSDKDYVDSPDFNKYITIKSAPYFSHSVFNRTANWNRHVRFYCTLCGKLFRSYAFLKKHRSSKHPQMKYTCSLCKKSFVSYWSLVQHGINHRQSFKHVKCDSCEEEFRNVLVLKRHRIEEHRGDQHAYLFPCVRCEKQFIFKSALLSHHCKESVRCKICNRNCLTYGFHERHQESHSVKGYTCEDCGELFKRKATLEVHKLKKQCHPLSFKCSLCKKQFTTRKSLAAHIRSHKVQVSSKRSRKGEVSYECISCKQCFKNTQLLHAHVCQQNTGKSFDCEVCGVQAKSIASLRRHMNDKHKSPRPFQFEICEQGFSDENALSDHLEVHVQKEFQCLVCKTEFQSQADLNTHKTSACSKSKEKVDKCSSGEAGSSQIVKCENCGEMFERKSDPSGNGVVDHECKFNKCEKCGKEFTSKKLFMKHKNSTCHKKKSDNMFGCCVCGSQFSYKNGLTVHMRKHTGEKPYKCEHCDRSFHIMSSLVAHRKTHSDQTSLVCDVCGQVFKYKSSLTVHRRIHTREKVYNCKDCDESFIIKQDLKIHKQVCPLSGKQKKAASSQTKNMSSLKKESRKDTRKFMKDSTPNKLGKRKSKKFPVAVKCKKCHRRFIHKPLLLHHMKSTHPEVDTSYLNNPKYATENILSKQRKIGHQGEPPLKRSLYQKVTCATCKKQFRSQEALGKHIKNKHAHLKFTCASCRKRLASYLSVIRHRKVHRRNVSCRVCEEKFFSVALMKAHKIEKEVDKEHDSMFSCERCRKQFFLRSLLLNHLCSEGVKCERCDKYLYTYGRYKKHMIRHVPDGYCDICDKFFESSSALDFHRGTHNLSTSLTCPFCDVKFAQKMELITHLKGHTDAEINPDADRSEVYRCSICKKLIQGLSTLKEHILMHTKSSTCEHCGKVFTNTRKSNLRRHIDAVHKGLKPFVCSICKKSFTEKRSLHDHMTLHTLEKPYKCEMCQGVVNFRTKHLLRKHLYLIHGVKGVRAGKQWKQEDRQPLKCMYCREVFVKKYALNKHIKAVHDQGKFHCDKCGRNFTSRHKFKRHTLYHQSQSENYVCDVCGKEYRAKVALTNHMRKHTGEKPYQCEHCQRRFAILSSLVVHRRTHTDERVASCDICGETFRYRSNLKAHSRKHMLKKEHKCTSCGKSFHFESDLRKHLETHNEDRPHQCPVCFKSFKVRNHLNRHFKTHAISRLIQCKMCGQVLISQEELEQHMKDKHDNEVPASREILEAVVEQAENKVQIIAAEHLNNGQCDDYVKVKEENAAMLTTEDDSLSRTEGEGMEIIEDQEVVLEELNDFDITKHEILQIVQENGEQIFQQEGVQYVVVQYGENIDNETLHAVANLTG